MKMSGHRLLRTRVILLLALFALLGAIGVLGHYADGYRKFSVGPTLCMAPTLNDGEVMYVKPFNPRRMQISRYQVVAFKSPLPVTPQANWVMRVIGLPGEQVALRTDSLSVNGSEITEADMPKVLQNKQWLTGKLLEPSSERQWKLAADEVFVVGDNLTNSNDSRFWGPLKVSAVIGIVEKKAMGKLVTVTLEPVLPIRATFIRRKGPTTVLDTGK